MEKNEIEMLLRNADYNKEFQLHYQPQINIQYEKLVGVEALIRWNSPVKGNIRPDKFIKIAKELIDKISTDTGNKHIVEAIVKMSKALGVTTIAEGVEIYEELQILKDMGCDEIQGYIFSKPLPASDLEAKFLNDLLLLKNERINE